MTKRLFFLAMLVLSGSVGSTLGCSGGDNSVDQLGAADGGFDGGAAWVDAGSPCVNDDGTCPSNCTAESDNDCDGDLTGVWFAKVSAPGSLSAADGALTNDAVISAWIRLNISATGDLTLNICKLLVDGESALATTYPPALIKTLEVGVSGSLRLALQLDG